MRIRKLMKELQNRISHIHYINNLWHLALENGDKKASAVLGQRKAVLQNKLIMDFRDRVILVHDKEASTRSGKKIVSIQFKDINSDACHIPAEKVTDEFQQ